MSLNLKTVPVIREAGHGEHAGFLFSFGACGDTHVAVIGGHLEDGLEVCLDWLDDNAPGLLGTVSADDYAEAAAELGVAWPPTDGDYDTEDARRVQESAECDMTMVGHTTLENGNCIPSWEWSARALDEDELATLLARFCRACTRELGERDAILCAECRGDLCERVASDLRIERIGLEPSGEGDGEDHTDVRLQVRDWSGPDWAIRVGLSDYDQDHRGHWGASSLSPEDGDDRVALLAAELVDQALEQAASSDE